MYMRRIDKKMPPTWYRGFDIVQETDPVSVDYEGKLHQEFPQWQEGVHASCITVKVIDWENKLVPETCLYDDEKTFFCNFIYPSDWQPVKEVYRYLRSIFQDGYRILDHKHEWYPRYVTAHTACDNGRCIYTGDDLVLDIYIVPLTPKEKTHADDWEEKYRYEGYFIFHYDFHDVNDKDDVITIDYKTWFMNRSGYDIPKYQPKTVSNSCEAAFMEV